MENDQQLAVRTPMPYADMERLAKAAAGSGMFGISKPEQALCLFAICQSEGLDPITALKRYHLIEGKPSMRADAMAAEFLAKGGAIIWHARTDQLCAATFFAEKAKLNNEARGRAITRFEKLWDLEGEDDPVKATAIVGELAKLSMDGEETIIRTYGDAEEKGLTTSWKEVNGERKAVTKTNWKQSPRQMLTARVVTEGVRLVAPGLIAGIYSPEEVHDIIDAEKLERAELTDRSLNAPDPRDRKAIQAMIDQYVEDAKTAKPARKSELLGLASELRVKLADMDLENDQIPSGPFCVSKIGNTTCGYPRDMHADLALGHEFEAPTGELPGSAEPELHLNGEPEPKEIPWEDYVLQYVKSKTLRGKRLGDFLAEDIRTIAEKTASGLESEDPKIRMEAEYIKRADEALNRKAS